AMLETIRLYAKERLEASGEGVKLSDRHLERYVQVASEGEYAGPNAAATLDRLETETGNLQGALAWGLSRRDARALALAMALSQFWDVRGRLEEGRGWLQQALAATTEDRADHLEGLVTLAWLVLRQGDLGAARDTLEQALQLQRRLRHREVAPRLYDNLGMVSLFDGDLEQARAQFRQSFVTATELGDEGGVSSALFHLALSAYFAGDREVAERQAAEALGLRRKVSTWPTAASPHASPLTRLQDRSRHVSSPCPFSICMTDKSAILVRGTSAVARLTLRMGTVR